MIHIAYVLAFANAKIKMLHAANVKSEAANRLLEFRVLGDGRLADKPFAEIPFSADPLYVDPTGRFLIAHAQDGLRTYRIRPNGTLGPLAATYRASVFEAITFAPNQPDIFYSPYAEGLPTDLSTYRLLPSGRIVRQPWHFTLKEQYGGSGFYDGVGDILFLPGSRDGFVQVLTGGAGAVYTGITPVRAATSGELQPWTPPDLLAHETAQAVTSLPHFPPPDPHGSAAYAPSPDGRFVYQASTHGLIQYRVMLGGSLLLWRECGFNLMNDGDADAQRVNLLVSKVSIYLEAGWLPYVVRVPVGKDGALLTPQAITIGLDGAATEIPLSDMPPSPLPRSRFQDAQIVGSWQVSPGGHYIYLATDRRLSLYRLLPDGRWRFLRGPILSPLMLSSPIFVRVRQADRKFDGVRGRVHGRQARMR